MSELTWAWNESNWYHSPDCHCRPGGPSPAGGPSPGPLTEPERQRYIAQAAEMGAKIERLRDLQRRTAGHNDYLYAENERLRAENRRLERLTLGLDPE